MTITPGMKIPRFGAGSAPQSMNPKPLSETKIDAPIAPQDQLSVTFETVRERVMRQVFVNLGEVGLTGQDVLSALKRVVQTKEKSFMRRLFKLLGPDIHPRHASLEEITEHLPFLGDGPQDKQAFRNGIQSALTQLANVRILKEVKYGDFGVHTYWELPKE